LDSLIFINILAAIVHWTSQFYFSKKFFELFSVNLFLILINFIIDFFVMADNSNTLKSPPPCMWFPSSPSPSISLPDSSTPHPSLLQDSGTPVQPTPPPSNLFHHNFSAQFTTGTCNDTGVSLLLLGIKKIQDLLANAQSIVDLKIESSWID
jgi:hypothetical protein